MSIREIYQIWKASGSTQKFCVWLRASGHTYGKAGA